MSNLKVLKTKVRYGEKIFAKELIAAIIADGVDRVRFMVPLKRRSIFGFVDGSNYDNTVCRIMEPFDKSNYKIRLVPIVSDGSVVANVDFYMADFVQMINYGEITIMAD